MSNILEFKKPSKSQKQKQQTAKQKGSTLCKEGHHRWQIVQEKKFETHSGKLMTVYRCSRCNKTKSKLL
jgi:hypothetical protein